MMAIGSTALVGAFTYSNNGSPIEPALHASVAEGDVTFGIFFGEDEAATWGSASGVYSHITGSPFTGGLSLAALNMAIVVGKQGATPAAPSLTQSGGAPSICAFTVSFTGTFDANPMDLIGTFFAVDQVGASTFGPVSGIGTMAAGAGVLIIGAHADTTSGHTLTTGDSLTWYEAGHGSTTLGADSSLWADYAITSGAQSIANKTIETSGQTNSKSSCGIIISFKESAGGSSALPILNAYYYG